MASGNYFTSVTPEVIAGLVLQSETTVRVGLYRHFYGGSLDTTSALYLAYNASIGLVSGNSFNLGELASVGLSHVPTFESPESANVLRSSLEVLSEEETTISTGIQQFDPRILELAVGSGVMYTIGNERLITVGGRCQASRRPMEIEAINVGCNAPSSPGDVEQDLSAIIITAYDCQCQSGLAWDEIVAGALNVMDLEWAVRPVNSLAAGNRLFNMYIF